MVEQHQAVMTARNLITENGREAQLSKAAPRQNRSLDQLLGRIFSLCVCHETEYREDQGMQWPAMGRLNDQALLLERAMLYMCKDTFFLLRG